MIKKSYEEIINFLCGRVQAIDIIIRNGLVVDGTGGPSYRADILVRDGKIEEIGSVQSDDSEVIEAQGLAVAPGFIDIHSHSDFTLLANPRAESKVRQGVTTEIVGNCGGSAAPALGPAEEEVERTARLYGIDVDWDHLDGYLRRFDRGVAINVATLVGHGTVRQCVMDMEERPPTQGEMDEMRALVAGAMEQGAFGLSSGLVYPPGRYADTSELLELCRVVADFKGIYASHIRGERETLIEAVQEALRIGREAGVPVQISHHPAKIGAWGRSPETLAMIDEAGKSGLDVSCDLHPYLAGSTGLSALLPPWAQEGGPKSILERLMNPEIRGQMKADMMEERVPGPGPCGLVKRGMWDMIIVSSHPLSQFVGKTVADIAAEGGADPFEAYFEVLAKSEAAGSIVGFYYNEEDIRHVLLHGRSMIGSDGYALAPYGVLGRGRNHPRSYGTFPMIFRKYVRGESRGDLRDSGARLLTLEEAVRKMTSMPASKLGIHDRGILKRGAQADIVIFDPNTIADTATYLDPYKYPTGVEHVLVNGIPVIFGGEHTGALPGKPLRHGS